MRVLLIGFGNVGKQIARILIRGNKEFPAIEGLALKVVGIVTKTRGSLVAPAGIDLKTAIKEIEQKGRFSESHSAWSDLDSSTASKSLDYDVLIELSTLEISSRGEPAAGYLRNALRRGKHCVSANKGPLAFHFLELEALARQTGSLLRFESTFMDGAPVFNLARYALTGCRILKFEGVINSTTNYILSRIEQGASLAAGISEAQQAGFAEADPSHDLDGWDSAAKLAVLANALFSVSITPCDVTRTGLRALSESEIRRAHQAGSHYKLLATLTRQPGGVEATVQPVRIAKNHPLAGVRGAGSGIILSTDLMGPLLIQQLEPGLNDTAYGVLNDLFEIQRLTFP